MEPKMPVQTKGIMLWRERESGGGGFKFQIPTDAKGGYQTKQNTREATVRMESESAFE